MTSLHLSHFLIPAADGVLLPSLLYTGETPHATLTVYVHGAGSSSILRRPQFTNTLAETLIKQGSDVLTFNNRGAGYITKFDREQGGTYLGGMAYERIAGCLDDFAGVLTWARAHNYSAVYFIGHSTGANKLVFAADALAQDAAVKGLILAGGGDDVRLQRSRYGADEIAPVERQITAALEAGRAQELVPRDVFKGEHPISWGSLAELLLPESDYDMFRFTATPQPLAPKLRDDPLPTLVIYGSNDFGTVIPPAEAIAQMTPHMQKADGVLIDGADHNFEGYELAFAEAVARWITRG